MLGRFIRRAHRLDEWLHQNLGRPYTIILTIGLLISIGDSLDRLGRALSGLGGGELKLVMELVFQGGLLVNQIAQWHDLHERRRQRTSARD
jgi:hypothetical protein